MNGLWKLLLAGVGIYVALTALIYFRQSSLIFYPNMPGRALIATPAQIGLRYEDVSFPAEDGVGLHGWFVPATDSKTTLLFFHGNAGNISHRLESIAIFNALGLDVFIFDYRGYGQSQGDISEEGTYRDAAAAWRYLAETRAIDAENIVVFGRSLGSSIAAWLASQRRPAGLIVESGFSSVPSMAQRLYPFLPVKWLASFSYDTASYVSSLSCPLLVVHSKNDEIIPFAEGQAVFDAAPADKRFLEISGGHNDGFYVSGDTYLDGIKDFVDAVANRP